MGREQEITIGYPLGCKLSPFPIIHYPQEIMLDKHRTNAMDFRATQLEQISSQPETTGNIVGKLGIVWTGFFAGIKLGDLVLLATLVYTVLQIGLLVYERIIKPIRAAREVRLALKRSGVLSPQLTDYQSSQGK